jgi:hypothetical protein
MGWALDGPPALGFSNAIFLSIFTTWKGCDVILCWIHNWPGLADQCGGAEASRWARMGEESKFRRKSLDCRPPTQTVANVTQIH